MKSNQIFLIVGLIAALFICTVIGGAGAYLWYTQQQEAGDSAPAEAVEVPPPTEPAAAKVAADPTATEPPADQTESEPTATPTETPPPTEAPAAAEQTSAGNVITWSGQDQPIAYGDTAQGTIAQIGDRHTYVFEGQKEERVTALLDGDEDFNFYLITQDDKGWDCRTYGGICQFDNAELPLTGEYRLIVDGHDSDTGDYILYLTKLNKTMRPIAYGQTVHETVTLVGDRHTYVFEGQAGERVTVLLDGNEDFNFYLIASDDRGWDCRTYSGICQLDNVELPLTGEYSVVVDGYEKDTGDYTLHLTQLDETMRSITYGETIEDTITLVGDRHTYVFEGQAGERITALLDGAGDFNFYIIAPDDRGWDCRTYSGECQFDTGELPVSGEYRVIVDGYEEDIGDYSLTLIKNSG